jgi:hypothetical protein
VKSLSGFILALANQHVGYAIPVFSGQLGRFIQDINKEYLVTGYRTCPDEEHFVSEKSLREDAYTFMLTTPNWEAPSVGAPALFAIAFNRQLFVGTRLEMRQWLRDYEVALRPILARIPIFREDLFEFLGLPNEEKARCRFSRFAVQARRGYDLTNSLGKERSAHS